VTVTSSQRIQQAIELEVLVANAVAVAGALCVGEPTADGYMGMHVCRHATRSW
jgi:hypothetical protein